MNREEFQRLALAYGGRISRWPAQYQSAAQRALEQDPELARVLCGASELDAALDAQRELVSDLRLSQLKARTLGLTRPAASGWTQVWHRLFARDPGPIVVGAVIALCIAWAVQSLRPPAPAGQQSLLAAILEVDSMSLEVPDEH